VKTITIGKNHRAVIERSRERPGFSVDFTCLPGIDLDFDLDSSLFPQNPVLRGDPAVTVSGHCQKRL
jgi:hypothetical protein